MVAASDPPEGSKAAFGNCIGYLQHVDAEPLQERGKASRLRIIITSLPGTFFTPDRPVAWITTEASGSVPDADAKAMADAFAIGDSRVFDQDPRFELIVLSEIASRALSPAVNDLGTAIDVTGTLVRLFVTWHECGKAKETFEVEYGRVVAPELCLADAFDDAFTGTARDGAGLVEVVVRLLKALESLAAIGDSSMRNNALRHARLALARAENAMQVPDYLTGVREAAKFAL